LTNNPQSSPSSSAGLVDLHAHTNESDGTYSPEELVQAAVHAGLSALAITDHDTFAGYQKAIRPAQAAGLQLVCGLELNSKLQITESIKRSAHVLAYFPGGNPSPTFSDWLELQRLERRERNIQLASKLQGLGIDITVDEVEARGKSLAGRPHFAKLLVEKGYAESTEDAFERFVGDDAPTFVDRQSPATESVIAIVRAGGGIPVLAHPIRLMLQHNETEVAIIRRLQEAGLIGLEVCHSEQSAELQEYYMGIARQLSLLPTGGSDFHGSVKPDVQLGTGKNGNVQTPRAFLDRLLATASVQI
jgi:3',5'-nucleoside bisphosphate phosphatase